MKVSSTFIVKIHSTFITSLLLFTSKDWLISIQLVFIFIKLVFVTFSSICP